MKEYAEMLSVTADVSQEKQYGELCLKFKNMNCPLMNAAVRTVLSKIPSMRIEHVYIWNESEIPQSMLIFVNGVGFTPIVADANEFEWENSLPGMMDHNFENVIIPTWKPRFESNADLTEKAGNGLQKRPNAPEIGSQFDSIPEPDPRTTLVFDIDVECVFDPDKNDTSASERTVFATDLVWRPIGDQKERLKGKEPRIDAREVLVTLRPGHKLKATFFAVKGLQSEHGKWCSATSHSKLKNGKNDAWKERAEWEWHVHSTDGSSPWRAVKNCTDDLVSVSKELLDDMMKTH